MTNICFYTLLSLLWFAESINVIQNFGFKTNDAQNAGSSAKISIRLLYDTALYECDILPTAANTEYSCDGMESFKGYGCDSKKEMFLENNDYSPNEIDSSEIEYVFVTDAFGNINIGAWQMCLDKYDCGSNTILVDFDRGTEDKVNVLVEECKYKTDGITLEAWQTRNTIIPTTRAACGYNDELSMVYIVGESDINTGEYDLISYNTSSDKIIQEKKGPDSLKYSGSGQNYVSTSTGDILYLQDYNIGRLVKGIGSAAPFVIYPAFSEALNVEGQRACIAISGDNNYIFVVGGSPSGTKNKVNQFLIYDIINNEWFNGPSMNIVRGNHACYATNNYLYAFGGDYKGKKDSIEKIDISSIDNIKYQLNKWNILSSTLTQAKNGLHAVKFSQYIYIIGGSGSDIDRTMVTDVDRFDTVNDMIYSDTSLPVGLNTGCVAAVQNKLYVFGGVSNTFGGYINDIYWTQIIDPCNGNCAPNEICVYGECKMDCA